MSSCKKSYTPFKSINISPAVSPANSRTFFFDNLFYKKTSLSFSLPDKQPEMEASMTVEAALAVPIFLFFIANILSLFIMYERYSNDLAALHQKGKNLAMLAHTAGDGGDELVHLATEQAVEPLYKTMGFDGAETGAFVYVRKWTGYRVSSDVSREEEEEYVYITESGTVYHRSRTCRHLRISLKTVDVSSIGDHRNAHGARYTPCEKCCNGQSTGLVFITDKGDKYHNRADCSGLKRTILTVRLSEVGGRGPCSLCGGT